MVPKVLVPGFSANTEAEMERRPKEAHLHNEAQLAERRRMEDLLPQDLRDSLSCLRYMRLQAGFISLVSKLTENQGDEG